MKANVSLYFRKGRPKPHQVRVIYPTRDGKRAPDRSWYFKLKSEAHKKMKTLLDDFEAGLTPEMREEIEIARAQCRVAGASFNEIVARGLADFEKTAGIANVSDTVEEATARYVEKLIAGDRRPASVKGARNNLTSIFKNFAGRKLASITQKEFQDYLSDKTVPTQRNYLRQVSPVLNLYKLPNWTANIRKDFKKEDQKAIRVFTLEEVKTVMRVALPHWRGQIALCLFAGLRPDNLHLLPQPNIMPDRAMIDLPSEVMKDRKNHFLEGTATIDGDTIPGIPAILWKWLEKYPYQPMKWSSLRGALIKRLKKTKVKWGHDILRHTFATYYYALHGLAFTAKQLCHADYNLVKRHYAGVATVKDAIAFFKYGPEDFPDAKGGILWPNKATLRRMIHETSPEEIGKHLGCSGAAVRKHLKKIGLKSQNWRTASMRKMREGLRALKAASEHAEPTKDLPMPEDDSEFASAISKAQALGL